MQALTAVLLFCLALLAGGIAIATAPGPDPIDIKASDHTRAGCHAASTEDR